MVIYLGLLYTYILYFVIKNPELRGWGGGGGGAEAKGMVSAPVWSENGNRPIVWNQVWFSRKLRECINIFIDLIPKEEKYENSK